MDVDMDLDLTVDAPEEQFNDPAFEVGQMDDASRMDTY